MGKAEPLDDRLHLANEEVAVIVECAGRGWEEPGRFHSAVGEVVAKQVEQRVREWQSAFTAGRLGCVNLATAHSAADVEHGVGEVHVLHPEAQEFPDPEAGQDPEDENCAGGFTQGVEELVDPPG